MPGPAPRNAKTQLAKTVSSPPQALNCQALGISKDGNSAPCYVAAWMGAEFGAEWIHLCVSSVHLQPGFPGGSAGKEPACQCRRRKRRGFDPWLGKIPWRRKWQPASVFLPGKFHGPRGAWRATVHGVAKSQTLETIINIDNQLFSNIKKKIPKPKRTHTVYKKITSHSFMMLLTLALAQKPYTNS